MWHTDPDIVYQIVREDQERKIADHLRRIQARRQKQTAMLPTILGQVGDLLVGAGERLRRRSQMSSPLTSSGAGF